MTRLFLVAVAGLIAACSSTPPAPYVPPDTEAGKLKTIAFLPAYGLTVDSPTQDKLANSFGGYWADVYPGAKWQPMSQTAAKLQAANLLSRWADQEKPFMLTGLMPSDTVSALCAAAGTAGIAQLVIFHAQAGSGASNFLFRPLFGGGGERTGAARVGMSVYSCSSGAKVWEGSQETSYSGAYTQLQFVEYAMYDLAKKIAPR